MDNPNARAIQRSREEQVLRDEFRRRAQAVTIPSPSVIIPSPAVTIPSPKIMIAKLIEQETINMKDMADVIEIEGKEHPFQVYEVIRMMNGWSSMINAAIEMYLDGRLVSTNQNAFSMKEYLFLAVTNVTSRLKTSQVVTRDYSFLQYLVALVDMLVQMLGYTATYEKFIWDIIDNVTKLNTRFNNEVSKVEAGSASLLIQGGTTVEEVNKWILRLNRIHMLPLTMLPKKEKIRITFEAIRNQASVIQSMESRLEIFSAVSLTEGMNAVSTWKKMFTEILHKQTNQLLVLEYNRVGSAPPKLIVLSAEDLATRKSTGINNGIKIVIFLNALAVIAWVGQWTTNDEILLLKIENRVQKKKGRGSVPPSKRADVKVLIAYIKKIKGNTLIQKPVPTLLNFSTKPLRRHKLQLRERKRKITPVTKVRKVRKQSTSSATTTTKQYIRDAFNVTKDLWADIDYKNKTRIKRYYDATTNQEKRNIINDIKNELSMQELSQMIIGMSQSMEARIEIFADLPLLLATQATSTRNALWRRLFYMMTHFMTQFANVPPPLIVIPQEVLFKYSRGLADEYKLPILLNVLSVKAWLNGRWTLSDQMVLTKIIPLTGRINSALKSAAANVIKYITVTRQNKRMVNKPIPRVILTGPRLKERQQMAKPAESEKEEKEEKEEEQEQFELMSDGTDDEEDDDEKTISTTPSKKTSVWDDRTWIIKKIPKKLHKLVDVKMEIFVRTWTGQIIILKGLKPTDTIENVKLQILDKGKIPLNQQVLILDHKKLEDSRTLHDYDIQSGSTVYLTFKLPPRFSDDDADAAAKQKAKDAVAKQKADAADAADATWTPDDDSGEEEEEEENEPINKNRYFDKRQRTQEKLRMQALKQQLGVLYM